MNGINGLGSQQMSFRGNAAAKGAKAADEAAKKASKFIAEEAAKGVNGDLPKGLKKVCKFLSDNDGEVQNQVINAVFTTTLAPLMIWKNPFSKKSEKDKAYSALRQPISAAIAVSGGLAATLGVNKGLDKLANEGYIKSLDLRMNPNESYLKAKFNSMFKQAKKDGREAEFLSIVAPDGVNVSGKASKDTIRACFENYAAKVKSARGKVFETLMKEAPENIAVENGNILVKGKYLASDIPNLSTQKQLNSFLQKFNVKNVKDLAGKSSEEVNAFVKSTIKDIGKDFSSFKKYALPFINIPVTVLTCTALNWVYPRFVETFFPSLVKSDKKPEQVQQGGNK